jgi:hypothetical protein
MGAIRIVEEDFVDWEPLVMRFHAPTPISRGEADRLTRFVLHWFESSVAADPQAWCFAKEWQAIITPGNVVEARCELMPEEAVSLLAVAVEREFSTISELRLGDRLEVPANPKEFDWMLVEAGEIEIEGELRSVSEFEISTRPVSILQFAEFLQATNYSPVPDATEFVGFTIDNARGQLGTHPSTPMIGVTYDDAFAYCNWANARLPTESQLARFFRVAVGRGMSFDWAFACWSSTSKDNDRFVAGNGPYVRAALDDPHERKRLILHRRSYGWPNPPCFRVLKP